MAVLRVLSSIVGAANDTDALRCQLAAALVEAGLDAEQHLAEAEPAWGFGAGLGAAMAAGGCV
jgi:hypothetical protein